MCVFVVCLCTIWLVVCVVCAQTSVSGDINGRYLAASSDSARLCVPRSQLLFVALRKTSNRRLMDSGSAAGTAL